MHCTVTLCVLKGLNKIHINIIIISLLTIKDEFKRRVLYKETKDQLSSFMLVLVIRISCQFGNTDAADIVFVNSQSKEEFGIMQPKFRFSSFMLVLSCKEKLLI